MKAYGYSKNNKSKLIELSECTLVCTLDELEKLIIFIHKYKNELKNGLERELWANEHNIIVHRHYDFSPEKGAVDLILASNIGNR